MNRPWILSSKGPARIYGYDGKIHPERASSSEWRAWRLMRARAMGTHTDEEWKALKEKTGCCVSCGSEGALTKDHIIPISRGGCDCLQNLQPLCQPCNSKKADRLA